MAFPACMNPTSAICRLVLSAIAPPFSVARRRNLICNISDIKLISTTVRAQAANELRDRILTGRLRPGDRLDLDQLTAEFGISRTPIREALLELSYEGLVAITPRSGMAVVGITPEDAVDNFAILAALAGKAAEMATGRITPDGAAASCARWPPPSTAPTTSSPPTAASTGPSTWPRARPGSLTYLRQAVRVVPGNYFELFPEQEERSRREHAALLDAMERGDADRRRARIMEARPHRG